MGAALAQEFHLVEADEVAMSLLKSGLTSIDPSLNVWKFVSDGAMEAGALISFPLMNLLGLGKLKLSYASPLI